MMRLCSKCQRLLPLESFDRSGRKTLADGTERVLRRFDCKACCRSARTLEANRSAQKRYRNSARGKATIRRARARYISSGAERARRHRRLDAELLQGARQRAKKLGLPIDLTREDIVVPERCPVLGIPLKVGKHRANSDGSPTLDRIVPALGYVRGNVAVISWRANRLKSDGTADELLAVANWTREAVAAHERCRRGDVS